MDYGHSYDKTLRHRPVVEVLPTGPEPMLRIIFLLKLYDNKKIRRNFLVAIFHMPTKFISSTKSDNMYCSNPEVRIKGLNQMNG